MEMTSRMSDQENGTDINNTEEADKKVTPQTGEDNKSDAAESSTYNWVNPKLRGGSSQDQNSQNPWNSSTGGNYWHYDERDACGNQGSGSYQGTPRQKAGGMPGDGGRGRQEARPAKGRRNGRAFRVKTAIGMALVFGAVAGLMMYAVYSLASHIRPIGGGTSAAVSSSSEEENVASSSAGRKAVSLQTTQQDLESGSTSDGAKMSVAEVTKACMPSVVTIATISVEEMRDFFGGTQQYQVQGAGTGVIIGKNDSELLIATNNHVVSGAQQLTVGFYDESAISATVKGTDASNDLAVVAVKLDDITDSTMSSIRVATVGNSDDLVLGEQVVVIGNALGYGQSVTSGYVSALDRTLELSDGTNTFTSKDLIQTDAAINSGNSGGALLNMRGELVGINEARSSYSSSGVTVDNVGYAIPMEKAKPILDGLMNQETRELVDEDSRGYLGATFTDVTSDYADFYQMPQGVCITRILRNGPADKAGLQRGDVITAIDGVSVMTYDELSNRLNYYAVGEKVKITYQRSVGGKYEEQQTEAVLVSEKDINRLKR